MPHPPSEDDQLRAGHLFACVAFGATWTVTIVLMVALIHFNIH